MNLEKEIFNARVSNYLEIIKEKVERLIDEHIDDIDLSVKMINGDFYLMAQEEYAREYKQGLYDKQCIKVS